MSAALNVDATGVTIDPSTIAELILLFIYHTLTALLCNGESYWHLTESLELQQGHEIRSVHMFTLKMSEIRAPA
jgi:hypothetical protein